MNTKVAKIKWEANQKWAYELSNWVWIEKKLVDNYWVKVWDWIEYKGSFIHDKHTSPVEHNPFCGNRGTCETWKQCTIQTEDLQSHYNTEGQGEAILRHDNNTPSSWRRRMPLAQDKPVQIKTAYSV